MPLQLRSRRLLSVSALLAAACLGLGTSAAKGANLYWDGGNGSWNTATNWSTVSGAVTPDPSAVPGVADVAVFNITGVNANESITLDAAQSVSGLVFASTGTVTLQPGSGAFSLTIGSAGLVLNPNVGAVVLGAPIVLGAAQSWDVGVGSSLTVSGTLNTGSGLFTLPGAGSLALSGIVGGTGGLTKSGTGFLSLTAANTFTGATTITGGLVSISDAAALGTDASAISVSGSYVRGFGGGSLRLAGAYGSGLTLTRPLSLSGNGPYTNGGVAFVSVGSNALSGLLSTGVGSVSTNLTSVMAPLAITDLSVGGTAGTTISTFGTIGSALANFTVSGVLSGTGTIQKFGSGTIVLNPSDASGFSGTIRVTNGSIRVLSASTFGSNTGTTTAAPIDLNGGTLELRADAAQATGKNVYFRNGSTLFVDHSPGGSTINATHTFASVSYEVANTYTFNGRDGFGASFTTAPVVTGDGDSTFTNNLNGTLTFTGAFWSNSNSAAARTLTLGGTGNTLISGSIIASGGANYDHVLVKSGTGTVTLTGVAATLDGSTSISSGPLVVTDFRSLGPSGGAAVINLGNATTTGGILTFGTSVAATAAGLNGTGLYPRVFNLNGTTGGGTLNASQSVAFPVVISANFTATGAGSKTLTLGGTNVSDNLISGAIVDNSGTNKTSLLKTDVGTWVLSGANTYTGATTISGGTLKLKATVAASDILSATGAVTFGAQATTIGQQAGGILEFVGVASASTTESLGTLTLTNGGGTIKLTSGGGSNPASLIFSGISGTVGKVVGVNIDASGASGGTVTLTGATAATATTMVGNGHLYFNGADFADINGSSVVIAPSYTVGGAIWNSAGSGADNLVASKHNLVTADQTAVATKTISSLKLGANTMTLASGATLTVKLGTNGEGPIVQSGGSGTITGGTALISGGTGALVFRVNGSSDQLTVGTPITTGSTGGWTKNGAGTLVFSAANTTTAGIATINEGTVRLSGSGQLGGSSLNLTIRQGATLDLNGVSVSTGSFNGAGTVTNGSSTAATFSTVGGDTVSFTGLVRDGAGVMNVTRTGSAGSGRWLGANTYTGVTTMNLGGAKVWEIDTLANYGVASTLGTGASVVNAAALVFTGASDSGISYLGSASVSTDRLFTLNSSTVGGGGFFANNAGNDATVIFANTGSIAFGSNATTVAQTLGLGGTSSGDNYFGPLIADSSGLATAVTKSGTGLWILANNNTYTGATTVTGGALAAVPGVGLPANSPLVLNGGVLQMSGTFSRTLSASPTAGTGTVTLQATASGFAAGASKLVVNLNGGGTLTFGAGGFFSAAASNLALNSETSLAELEIRNNLDLGAAAHTFTVTDNSTTGADFVTISGVLSNGTNLTVSAASNTLQLLGANTYTGTTTVSAGILAVNSLGSSSSPAGTGSSLGISGTGVTFGSGNALLLGNGAATGGVLQYVGPGETSDRWIQLRTTTGANQILADGTGPLVLTNVRNDLVAGSKTLYLRGSNTQGNTISSSLSDYASVGVDKLSLMIDGGATWILTGANNYTGTTIVSSSSTYTTLAGGSLGLGADNCLGSVSELQIRNGTVFASGGDRLIGNPLSNGSATTTYYSCFVGDYSLTFTGANTMLNTTVNHTLTNNIVAGKSLTFSGAMKWDTITAARTLTVNGAGNTSLANITTATANGVNITYVGTGVLTLTGTGSNWNAGLVTVSSGTLRLGASEVIPDGTGKGGLTLAPATGVTATFDLRGYSETINGLTATSAGNVVIDNTASGASTLTVGAADSTGAIGGGGGTFTVSNTGAGELSIVKTGTTSLTIPAQGSSLNHRGATSVTGGTLVIAAPLTATTSLSVTGAGSNLSITGAISAPSSVTSLTVAGGAFLSLQDGAGSPLTSLTSLNLGAGTGIATLSLDLGSTSDLLAVSSAPVIANAIRFNLNGVSGLADATTYTLISAPGGLNAGTYQLGSQPGGFTSGTLTFNDTTVSYTTGSAIISDTYWNNTQATGSWATNNSGATNFTTDLAGTTEGGFTPGPGSTVYFGSSNPATLAGTSFATTLDASFTVAGVKFTANPTGVTTWSIAPGTLSTNSLTIRSAGVDVAANAGAVTISAPIVLGVDQAWSVDGTGANGSSLTIASAISGVGRSLTKTGNGVLNLTAASSFDGGLVLKAGTVIGTVSALTFGAGSITLGDTTGSTSVFLQSNTSALTFARPLVLASGTTGTLSVGTPVNAAAVNVTFSAGVTGTNTLTVNNQSLSGTTTFSLQPINQVGSFTNVSTSTGTVTISGGVGANVTRILESSATSALTISSVSSSALTVNSLGTTLANESSAGKVLTLSAPTAGTGDLILQSAVAGVSSVIVVSGAPNHVGRIINSGTGTAATNGASAVLSGILGANITGIVQDSATSPLSLSANNANYAGGMLIKKGVLIALTNSNALGSAANVITIGDSAGSADATLGVQTDATLYQPQIVVVAGNTGVARITSYTTTGQPTLTGAITLDSHDLSIETGGTGFTPTTGSLTVTGGITSTGSGGNVTLRNASSTTGTITLSTGTLNFVGSLTNAGSAGTSGVTVSARIGANVTGIVQNSATSPLTLSGVNSSSGGVTLVAGTLKIANSSSLGSGPIIGNGGTLDNTTGSSFTVSSSRLTIESSFAFAGSSSLDLGTIPVGLGASVGPSRTLTVSANTLTVGGTIADGTEATTPATSLTKAGAGMLLLTGANTFTGGFVAAGGVISLSADSALGAASAPFAFNGGTLQVTGTSFSTWSGARALTFPGAATFDIVAEANAFAVGTPAFTAGGLTKLGLGSLSFTNAISLGTTPLVVKAGILRVGANISLTSTVTDFVIGNTVLAAGMGGALLNQSGGTISITGTDVETAQIGSGIGAFGAYVLTGGTYSGTRISVGAAGATGMLTVMNGATFNTVNYFIGGRGATAAGAFTLAGGTVNQVSTGNTGAWGGGRFEMNIGPDLGGGNVGGVFNRGISSFNITGSISTSFGVLNLNGGTLNASSISSIAITAGGGAFLNFDGGTAKATAASATFLSANLTSAYVRAGGGTIDNGGFAITLVKAIDAPAGAGVGSISLSGGTGYFTAPYVKLTGGGGNNDATAIALIDGSGNLTSILITNPGTGYTSAPTVTIVGGTHGTAATATATLNSGNISGGMTFRGAGTTTLSTANTYSGPTTLSSGIIGIGVNSSFLIGTTVGGPFGTGQVTVADGVTLDPGTASNRTLGAAGFTFNGDVAIGTATTTTRLMVGAPIGLAGGTRTFSLVRSGSAANQVVSGNEAFKLMQQVDGPAVAISNGTLRIAADASVTSTFVAVNFDTINSVPISFMSNAGLTLAAKVLGIVRVDNPFGTSAGTVPRLTLESGSYYSLSSGATASYDTTVFSLAGAGTLTNLDTTGGVATLTVLGSDSTTFSGIIADGVDVNTALSLALPVGSVVRLTHDGTGTLALTGANTYTGATSITGGTLAVMSLGDGVNASSLGKSTLAAANLIIAGGTLRYDGAGETSDRGLTASGSVTLDASGSGALLFSSAAKIAFADTSPLNRFLTLTGSNTGANTFGFGHDDLAEPASSVFNRLVKNGIGVWVISGPDTVFRADSLTQVLQGVLGFDAGTLGSLASPHTGLIQISDGATLRWESGNTDDLSARLSVAASAQATLDVGANQVSFASVPAVDTGGSIRKVGAGNLILASTSLGSTNYAVAEGRLTVNGSAGNINVANGGELGGVGTVGAINLAYGGTLSPGSSPGTLASSSVAFVGGSTWTWELRELSAGQGTGYDFLNISGNLDLSGASVGNRITLKLVSLGAGNAAGGTPVDFNLSDSLQSINIGYVGGSVTGLGVGMSISDVFQFDTSQFVYANGDPSSPGLWMISWDSSSHFITLTAVPEPSTYGFGLGALALAAAAIRRRKRQEKKT